MHQAAGDCVGSEVSCVAGNERGEPGAVSVTPTRTLRVPEQTNRVTLEPEVVAAALGEGIAWLLGMLVQLPGALWGPCGRL